jgi:hypothetical protein
MSPLIDKVLTVLPFPLCYAIDESIYGQQIWVGIISKPTFIEATQSTHYNKMYFKEQIE